MKPSGSEAPPPPNNEGIGADNPTPPLLGAGGLLLIQPGDTLLVATSGGPDSLSLLHALHNLRDALGLRALHAAHFDHQLRGNESAADAAFVQGFCNSLQIPCHIGNADVAHLARQRKVSIQQAARDARYEFLEEIARTIHADKIATAHTQDDQVETVLLNILRGTGLEGLRGIPAQRGLYIRPLLETSRLEIESYCAAHHLTPRRDPSNADTDHYTRNRIRLELIPSLARDYNPTVATALLRLSEVAARDADYLRAQAEATLPEVILSVDPDRLTLDNAKLRLLHPALLRHVLRAALRQTRGTLTGITYDHLESLCAAINRQTRLPFGITTPPPHYALRITPRRLTITFRSPIIGG